MDRLFLPEGIRVDYYENRQQIGSVEGLREAMHEERILEARAILCDAEHNLYVDLSEAGVKGVIPRQEGALGIADGSTRDIALIARVSKAVCFVVTDLRETEEGTVAILSRRRAQELCKRDYLETLVPGDIIPAKVTRLESFGAFCDVGCGLPALLPIAALSVSRISHPADRLAVGQEIPAVVTSTENGRITLSQRELFGTWEENARLFSPGQTVAGIVRSVEPYGIFVELTPNLAGLAEPHEGVKVGQAAGVFIKNILPEKMKVKLVIIDSHFTLPSRPNPRYFLTEGHIDRFVYSPEGCPKQIVSDFT